MTCAVQLYWKPKLLLHYMQHMLIPNPNYMFSNTQVPESRWYGIYLDGFCTVIV